MRVRQRNRKISKDSFCSDLMKWDSNTRERLIQTDKNGDHDKKWGQI